MNLIHKIGSKIIRAKISRNEKKSNHLKYYLEESPRSDWLIVVFSGFPAGNTANYNYIRTLGKVKCNKLFLLDDFGADVKPGTYYLGENGDWFLITDVIDLINSIKRRLNINHIIMVGSSKGGTSALFYSLKMDCVEFTIIGAPQYYVGNYLSSEKNQPILKAIMGLSSEDAVTKLNCYLKETIISSNSRPHIYIHYSPKEHTYIDHIKPMIEELRLNGFTVDEDNDYTYTSHSEVAKYFPSYLLSIVNSKIEKKK